MTDEDRALSAAVVACIGRGRSAAPVVSWHGVESLPAPEVRAAAEGVVQEAQRLEPDWPARGDDLWAGGRWAQERMHEQPPSLDADALEAVDWLFTFQWR